MSTCQSIHAAIQVPGRICMEAGFGSFGTAVKLEELVVDEVVMDRLDGDIVLAACPVGRRPGFIDDLCWK
jgi:hypothetical protein